MKRLILILSIGALVISLQAQVFLEKQTRHRFAQLNLGVDYQADWGGHTFFLDENGQSRRADLPFSGRPRFIVGGTHFWGHADFYIAISLLRPVTEVGAMPLRNHSRVETGFRVYPWPITDGRLRPFAGLALGTYQFDHLGQDPDSDGPNQDYIRVPLLAGITLNKGPHLWEIGASFNYFHELDYLLTPLEPVQVSTPPFRFSVGYKYMIETTLSAEPDWESGRTQAVTDQLANDGQLNSFFLGAGVSSAWWLRQPIYNQEKRPYLPKPRIETMADFSLGYYWHRPDLSVSVNYRSYESDLQAFNRVQGARRRSVGFEITKFLFDYHGFVPFVGPAISYEQLQLREGLVGLDDQLLAEDERLGYGVTLGWDIRPNRLQGFLLRTNLRYWPHLPLLVDGEHDYNFQNIEFNFIQLIVYPGRIF